MAGAIGAATALVGGILVAAPAQAVSGAVFTTGESGERVNQNQYASKCDVFINGGPNNGRNTLSDGQYFFSVLTPGGQNDPNDGAPKVLYDGNDPYTNRTFSVSGGKITGYSGGHASVQDASTQVEGDLLIQLCQNPDDMRTNFADTENPGGVYILAVCELGGAAAVPVDPRDCKYDAFKVRGATSTPIADLVAIKDAATSYTRTYTWDVEKDVDKTLVSQHGGTATFTYTVAATKSAPADSGFRVTGEVTVFNPNDVPATGVTVADSTLGQTCAVSGGAAEIPPRESTTFAYDCNVSAAPGVGATTADTNVATVSWDQGALGSPSGSTTAEASYGFADAVVTSVGDATDVTDTFADESPVTLATGLTANQTFTYSRSVAVPASNCVSRTNTATVTGDSDSETVRVCGPNSDGYTIGFWKNNSSKVITSTNLAAYCSAVNSYKNVLGSPRCGTTKDMYAYISKTMSDGEASVDGVPMLRAQFLATVLNVQRTSALGATGLHLTQAESTAVGTTGCAVVSDVLSGTNARYSTISATKASVVLVKDVFDRVNNNRQLTC